MTEDYDNWRRYRFLHRDAPPDQRAKPLSTLLQEEEKNWKAIVDSFRNSLTEKEISILDQSWPKRPPTLTPEEIEFGQKLMDEPDWEKEKAYLEDLKAWREQYDKWHGFSPPKGAEALWSTGWEMAYKRQEERINNEQ